MGFGFLKTIGKVALTASQVAIGVGPVLSQQIPQTAGVVAKVNDDITTIAGIIEQAEIMGAALGNISGPDKLKAVTPLVAQVIIRSSLVAGKQIANETMFTEGCQNVADGIVKVLNSLKSDQTA